MPYRKLYFVAALVGVLVLGFVATSVIGYYVARDSLNQRIAEETLPLTSDNVYSEIEQDLLRSVLIASLMAHDTFLRDWTLRGESDAEPVIRYLQQIQRKYATTTAFFTSERSRRYYHPSGVLRTVSRERPQDTWYFRVRDMDAPYEINVDTDTADPRRLTIFVNYRVHDYSGNYIGATGIGLSVESVAEMIAGYERRYGRRIYFVDRDGEVRLRGAHFAGAQQLRERAGLEQAATRILSSPSTAMQYTGSGGQTVYLNSRLIPEFDWYLIVEQSGSAAETRILNTLLINIAIALLIASLVMVTAWFTVRGYQVRLEEMATRDEVSGAASRQVFAGLFDQVERWSRRTHVPMSLIALDIDHFKAINDTHGHAAGDAVIRQLAQVVGEHIRDADTLCRWGGDEFLVLLGDCALADAGAIAESIRAGVEATTFRHGGTDIAVSVSVGVAQHERDEDLSGLAGRADQALYAAKHGGRNRTNTA